jgi:hypothetical protein
VMKRLYKIAVILILLVLCTDDRSWAIDGRSGGLIAEYATGIAQVGYVEATLQRRSQPVPSGTLVLELSVLGIPLPEPPPEGQQYCTSQDGCGYLTTENPEVHPNGCTPAGGSTIRFQLSGTFCEGITGAWTYSGTFSVTSDGAAGVGTINAAGVPNTKSTILLSGALAR